MAHVTRLELELERDVSAPAQARSAVSEHIAELAFGATEAQTLVLLVSELVSNAVRHSSGPADASIRLLLTATADGVRVAVTDPGEGFIPRPRDPQRIGEGYGLYLLEQAARSWGVETVDGTTVWFELARASR